MFEVHTDTLTSHRVRTVHSYGEARQHMRAQLRRTKVRVSIEIRRGGVVVLAHHT